MRKTIMAVGCIVCLTLGAYQCYAEEKPIKAESVKKQPLPWIRNLHKVDTPITGKIELAELGQKGVKVLENYSGLPDKFGISGHYELVVPAFKRGCYFASDLPKRWPEGANHILPATFKDSFSKLDYGGVFVVLELKAGGYLAIVPIAGPLTMSWLSVSEDSRLTLSFGTLGTEPVSCDVPLFAFSKSDDLYTACREAWTEAVSCKIVAGSTALRKEKLYPEIFKYLGWCSWEEYKREINEELLINAVRDIEKSGLGIRYIIVDDGHLESIDSKRKTGTPPNAHTSRLLSFTPDSKKFPNGWGPLLKLRKDDKVRWIGLWHNFNGYWDGISPQNDFGVELNKHLTPVAPGILMVRNDPASARAFYEAYIGSVKKFGFDFVKIDNQARNLAWYIGATGNAVQAANNCSQALEAVVNREMNGLINCMAHNTLCVFNTRYSAVTRSSIDYEVGNPKKSKSHLWQSYNNTLWLCQTVWPDHDMFHSSDPYTGRMMAVSKSLSAGPVYLSDNPNDFVVEYIRPLCYEDGELLRPLAPAGPLPDSALIDPMAEPIAYRVIAPLSGGAAAIVAYNLCEPTPEQPIKTAVTSDDYTNASGMIQPYPGKWQVPTEGLIVYDWYTAKAEKLGDKYSFELEGFTDRLLLLCPIRKGWAVIGRTDKYLSPAAVEVISATDKELKLRLAESGPLAVWSTDGVLSTENILFEKQKGGLWKADIEPGKRDMVITIKRASPCS